MAFAPDYATSGRFYVYLTAAAARARSRICASTGARRRTRTSPIPASGAAAARRSAHTDAANHNGGQLQFGPDGKLWLGDRRRRRRRRPVRARAGPGLAARQADPARPGRARAGGRRARAAQPVALLVRPRDRAARDRRRRPGRVRGDRRRARRQLRLAVLRGRDAADVDARVLRQRDGAAGADQGARGDGFCSITGGYVVRDPGPADAARPLPVRRLLRRRGCGRSTSANPRLGRGHRAARVDSLSSFGEDACGRILVVSLAGPVYRLVDGAPSACARRTRAWTGGRRPADTRACVVVRAGERAAQRAADCGG